MARDRAEERGARVAELQKELSIARAEAAGQAAQIDRLQAGRGGQQNTDPSGKTKPGDSGAGWQGEMVEVLRDALRCEREEVDLLRTMIRSGGRGGGKAGKEEVGVDNAAASTGRGLGASGGGYTADDWRKLASQGLDSYGFGQYGIKRPLFMAVRNTYFGGASS